MGCNSAIIEPQTSQPAVHTLFGVAKLDIITVHKVHDYAQGVEHYLVIKMTNQKHQTNILHKPQMLKCSLSFQFIVNSRHQKFGRGLSIQLWQKGMFGDSFLGVGIEDFDYQIKDQGYQRAKIYLNKEKALVGWVEVQVNFTEKPTDVITIVFDNALIRRKARATKCKIRVEIGEEVLETRTCEDKEDCPPSWKSDMLTFYIVRDEINEGRITILDDQTEIGGLALNLQQIVKSQQQQIEIKQQFYFQETIVAGTIKFYIKKGDKFKYDKCQTSRSVFISPKKKLPPLREIKIGSAVTEKYDSSKEKLLVKENIGIKHEENQQRPIIQMKNQQPLQKIVNSQSNAEQQSKLKIQRQKEQQLRLKRIEEEKEKAKTQQKLRLEQEQQGRLKRKQQEEERQRVKMQRQAEQRQKREDDEKHRLKALQDVKRKQIEEQEQIERRREAEILKQKQKQKKEKEQANHLIKEEIQKQQKLPNLDNVSPQTHAHNSLINQPPAQDTSRNSEVHAQQVHLSAENHSEHHLIL